MHAGSRRNILVLVAVGALLAVGYFVVWPLLTTDSAFTVSGTVEATEVRLSSERGGRVETVSVDEGDSVMADQIVAEIHSLGGSERTRERVRSPIDAVVLYRSAEPGEFASPGQPLITVGDLTDLTLTVYVPEDRYGRISLGQMYPVTVDSYPDEVFAGRVKHIADSAEFTPRNVQTTDSRKSTVFAIRLSLPGDTGKLKPGMPADVRFNEVNP